MIGADDLLQMQTDMMAMVGDAVTSLVIRRGGLVLPAQSARIARAGGGGSEKAGISTGESRGRVVVFGDTGFDVAVGDRFNDGNGVLYQVVLVRPNRRVMVVAEAEVVE